MESTQALGLASALAVATGIVLCVVAAFGGEGTTFARLARYEARLGSDLAFLRLPARGVTIWRAQISVCALAIVLAGAFDSWPLLTIVVPALSGPSVWLGKRRTERVTRLEEQLDSWLLVLSNALKATASLGEAIASSLRLVGAPMRQELEHMLKEYELGAPLDRALHDMATRIGSTAITGAVASLTIARNTGGDLPTVLASSSAALREMSRLEGVVRTKTAEGKAQALVISLIPFPLVGAIHWMSPDYFEPLASAVIGHLVVVGALVLWLVAIFLATKIVEVDV